MESYNKENKKPTLKERFMALPYTTKAGIVLGLILAAMFLGTIGFLA